MSLTQKEIAGVLAKKPENRYKYFIKHVCREEEVWGLADVEGWLMLEDDEDGTDVLAVFPAPEFAAIFREKAGFEEFQVEVLGVLENVAPKQSIILARLTGGPLAETGVLQGMSGSPVYINGKLAGAVALGFAEAKVAIAGIRPIEEMLKVDSEKTPAQTPVRRAGNLADPIAWLPARDAGGFGDTRMTEVATPLSLSGFTSNAVAQFGQKLY